MEEADIKEDCAKIEEQNEKEDYNGGMCSLFDNDVAPARSKQEAIVITNVYVPDLLADIPSDWTGKRPKDLFLEQCRKKKIPKPIFSKIPATKNGCTIKLKMKGGAENVIQHEGPFSSFKDAEHFVSTKALYELDPNVPLYRLLPPLEMYGRAGSTQKRLIREPLMLRKRMKSKMRFSLSFGLYMMLYQLRMKVQ